MGKKIIIVFLLLTMAVGLFVMQYPWLHAQILTANLTHRVQQFRDYYKQEAIDLIAPSDQEKPENAPIPYEDLLMAIRDYNEQIHEEQQSGLSDPSAYERSAFDLTDFGLKNQIFGILRIPGIFLEMPVYLGASEGNLFLGVCVMGQTSIPIGGENTNSVIAGHRGWDGAGYLVDIDKIQLGDDIYITNLWETLHYRVSEIRIIQPNDVEAIHIQEGRDLVTLLTCHPYRSGGLQRYLVICERC